MKYEVTQTIECVHDQCTGCRVCEQVCPRKCIHIKSDNDGFLYPEIEKGKCVSCGKCLKACHLTKPAFTNVDIGVYGYSKRENLRREGSSGGAFSAIVECAARNSRNLWVFGSVFDEENTAVYQKGFQYPEYKKLCKSKYVFSDPRTTFSEVKDKLEKQYNVIYCGTPCQIGALKSYLQSDYTNLLTIDFICHGVPSEKFMQQHISYICKGKRGLVEFRSKALGWGLHKYCLKINDENGKVLYFKKAGKDFFFMHFLQSDCLRRGCYSCSYSGVNVSDLTLGDFWEITRFDPKFDDGKGISVVFANSEKGIEMLEVLSDEMELKQLPENYHRSHCGCNPEALSKREAFLGDLRKNGIAYMEKKFVFLRPWSVMKKIAHTFGIYKKI